MNNQILYLPGPMPGLNDLLDLAKRQGKIRSKKGKVWNSYAKTKAYWNEVILWEVLRQKIIPVERAYFKFTWIEKNRHRDMDNIAAAKKIILDGLVHAKILQDDGWKQVEGWEDRFSVQNVPGVEVGIYG